MLLAFDACADLSKRITDSLVDEADKATIGQLIAEGGGISTENCGGQDDALQVKRIEVEPGALVAVLHGVLGRPLGGGTVSAKMKLKKPTNISMSQHLKYVAATAFTRARKFSEPLCKHLGMTSEETCTIPAGRQEMRLSFKQLPEVLFAGKYDLEIHVADEVGLPVACIQGGMTVKQGKSQNIMRKLDAGCPWFIMEHWDSIQSISVSDDCGGTENKKDLNFEMKPGSTFWMQGHWYENCKNPEDTMFRMWKRYDGLFQECDKNAEDACGWMGCSGVMCVEAWDQDGLWRCEPREDDTHPGRERCQSDAMEYHVHPDDINQKCYDGAPVAVSASPRHAGRSGASAALLLATFALPLARRA